MENDYMNLFGSKKREQAREAAQETSWQSRYPLVANYQEQANSIAQAQMEYNTINAQPAHTAGSKRVKARQLSTLSSWIQAMKANLKDIYTGVAPAVEPKAPMPSVTPVSSTLIPNAYAVSNNATPAAVATTASTPIGFNSLNNGLTQGMGTQPQTKAAKSNKKIIFIAGGIVVAAVLVALLVKKKK